MDVKSRRALFPLALAFWGFSAPESDAQWVQARNLPGGRIRDYCAIDSGYFLAMEGRIFRSDDEGASWTPMPSPGKDSEVYSLEEFEGTLLAGTPEGVYQSPIRNVSWKPFDRPGLRKVPALSIWTYLGYLYIGSEGAVYKSIDQGGTWVELKSGLPREARITCFAGIVKIAVAGSENRGVFITESTKWIAPPDSAGVKDRIRDLDVLGNRVYAVTVHGVRESTNLGADWALSPIGLPAIACLQGFSGSLFAGTDQGIHASLDGGKTWKDLGEGIPAHTAIRSLADLGGSLFASTETGVWRLAAPTMGIPSLPSGFPPPPRPPGRKGSRSPIGITLPDSDPLDIQRVDCLGRRVRPWDLFPE